VHVVKKKEKVRKKGVGCIKKPLHLEGKKLPVPVRSVPTKVTYYYLRRLPFVEVRLPLRGQGWGGVGDGEAVFRRR
jgi:hypothetical protein